MVDTYRLFFRIYAYLNQVNPKVIQTYLNTENPITRVFAETTIGGMKVDHAAILRTQVEKRKDVAQVLIQFKKALREVMPSQLPPMHEKLLKYEKWYKPESHEKYFNLIHQWLKMPDDVSDYAICTQVKCATGNAWIQDEKGINAKPTGTLSINHYMAMRYVLFVIMGLDCKASGGKIQSDKEARAEMLAELKENAA